MNADRCTCEHRDHFNPEAKHPRLIGEPADDSYRACPTSHTYGISDATPFQDVKTAYGTFTLCRPCFEAGHAR